MKNKKLSGILIAGILLIGIALAPVLAQSRGGRGPASSANTEESSTGIYDANFSGSIESVIEDIETESLSPAEREGIILMREEEKLARDVYLTLAEKWDIPVFSNIAGSEETHMEAMGLLIERYDLEDPTSAAGMDSRGEYSNPDFDELYADLVERGLDSFEAALEVGALIEDLDIADLQRLISESDNDDIKIVYQNLLKGSRNHLRSFTAQLSRSNGSYSPEYISEQDFQRIVSSRNEAGVITDPEFQY